MDDFDFSKTTDTYKESRLVVTGLLHNKHAVRYQNVRIDLTVWDASQQVINRPDCDFTTVTLESNSHASF